MRTVGFELILEALDASLDSRKIAFAMGGLLVTGAVIGLLLYLAQAVDSGLLTIVLLVLAGLAAWILAGLVYGTIAKMSYDDLSRRTGHGWYSALGYMTRRLPTLLLSPLVLLIAIVLIVVLEGLVLMAGRIPYVGELWASLLFLPLVVVNLFLVLLSSVGVWLVPAVVAGEGGGILRTLGRVRQAVRRAPGRLLAYLSIATVLGVLAALIVVPLAYGATLSTMALTTVAMGPEKMTEFSTALPGLLLDHIPDQIGEFLFEYGYGFGSGSSPVTYKIAGAIFAVAILLISIAILAVLSVVFPVSCACASYLSVRQDEPEPSVPPPTVEPAHEACPNCGAAVSPEARFCLRCGSPLKPGS